MTKAVFVSYRLNDSCALLVKPASTELWAKCWSLCQTPWSCCSRSRCWSERDRNGPPSLRTQTSLCRSWWLSGSPSSVPVGPESRRQADHTSGLMCQSIPDSCTGCNSKLSSLFWTSDIELHLQPDKFTTAPSCTQHHLVGETTNCTSTSFGDSAAKIFSDTNSN